MGWPDIPRLAKGIIAKVICRICQVLSSGVSSLRCPSRFLVYFVSSVFSTTRISTRSCSYKNSSLGVRIWWIPPQDRNFGITLEIVLLVDMVSSCVGHKVPKKSHLVQNLCYLCPFRLTACIDRVMGDLAYDLHRLNQAREGCITQQSTMAICEKNTPLTLRRQPIDSSTHNNQPITGGHNGGEDIEEVQ